MQTEALVTYQRSPQTTPVSNGDRRAAVAGKHTRLDAKEIERLPFDLSALEDEGIFVNVDATGFGMLDGRLEWEALGIKLPKQTDVAFRPPRCGLLPNRFRQRMMTAVSNAHSALRKYSYRFRLTETVFETPAYRWIPWRAFPEFEKAFNKACDNLKKAIEDVLNDYVAIRDEVVAAFNKVATDSARRLSATSVDVPMDFEERISDWAADAFPTREELQNKLVLRFQVGVILLGSEMLREQRAAAEERWQIEHIEAERRVAQARVRAEEGVAQKNLWAAEESARRRLEDEESERRLEADVKERIRQMKHDAAREKLQKTLSPLQEGADQLRGQIYESAVAMHEVLQKNDFLPGATAKKARNLARWFRMMNFQSDAELDHLLSSLERLAAKPTGKSRREANNDEVKGVLDNIIQVCRRDAHELAQPNRMAALEVL